MKVSSTILATLAIALAASASALYDPRALASRHSRVSHRSPALVGKSVRKRCKAHGTSLNNGTAPTNTPPKPKGTGAQPDSSPSPHILAPTSDGVIKVNSKCGGTSNGATKQITRTSGPNGSIDWLNCGLTEHGWTPIFLKLSDLVLPVSLSEAMNSAKSPFLACRPFVHLFEKAERDHDIPAIVMAAFALQESSCNPGTIGGGGEQGLMQITREKCAGRSDAACREPGFNIDTGARFFSQTLKSNNGNVLLSIGSYNGWHDGLTYNQATAASKSHCCTCQNNLDYLHQFLNGWLQNHNAYDQGFRLGKYFNLDVCHR